MTFDPVAVFHQELDRAASEEAFKSGFPVEDWFWSGPRDGVKSIEWWYDNGPAMVQNFIDWWEHNPDAEIWVTPDGIPAIELPLEGMFGSVLVKGYLDLGLTIGTALVVVDNKTSAKAPVNYRQLGIYACLIEMMYGIRPRYGTYFMARGVGPRNGPKTHFLRPIELDKPQYSISYLAREFEMARQGIQAGIYPASPGENCGRCGVAYACTEAGGDRARELDPNYPGGKRA